MDPSRVDLGRMPPRLTAFEPRTSLADMRLGMVGALLAGLAVAAAAFGTHGLSGRLDPAALTTFETAARYQLYHALAILFAAERALRAPSRAAEIAGNIFIAGIVLFSGSLYARALGGPEWLAMMTPFGGLTFMAGWVALALSFRGR
jgi:uncharacterized membrane protein YgdD (TMEM256/DUF423 family)